jgi:hypothetical protein
MCVLPLSRPDGSCNYFMRGLLHRGPWVDNFGSKEQRGHTQFADSSLGRSTTLPLRSPDTVSCPSTKMLAPVIESAEVSQAAPRPVAPSKCPTEALSARLATVSRLLRAEQRRFSAHPCRRELLCLAWPSEKKSEQGGPHSRQCGPEPPITQSLLGCGYTAHQVTLATSFSSCDRLTCPLVRRRSG